MHSGHFLLSYRPEGEGRWTTPADVCDTCSDLDLGVLVPVSFCILARQRTDEYYAFLSGGPEPEWLLTPDAAVWRAIESEIGAHS